MDLNTLLLAFIAACNALTPILWMWVRTDMRRLEQNTNSKMDSLLAVTAASEYARGMLKRSEDEKPGPT